jgi:transglutaminase-like putative cysteine protease
MVPEMRKMVGRVTFLLLCLATAAVEMAADHNRPAWQAVVWASGWVALAAVLGKWASSGRRDNTGKALLAGRVLSGLLIAPFVLEYFRPWMGHEGYPLELQLLFGLRNLGLGLAAFSVIPLCMRSACVVSLFLMLFSVTMSDHPVTMALLAGYTAVGSLWLVLVYWGGLRSIFAEPVTGQSLATRPVRGRFPMAGIAISLILVAAVVALVGAAAPRQGLWVLAEWLPTSGGTGHQDSRARGGVNDGDEEAAGENPESTGNVNSDIFLDSPLPTLYDLSNDMFGEPFKPREQERAIALDINPEKARETGKAPPDSQRPGRGFPTARKPPKKRREAQSRDARALFEVEGLTPLHLRLTVFDRIVAGEWKEAPHRVAEPPIEMRENRWMHPRRQGQQDIYALNMAHKFRMTAPEGSFIPSPPSLRRFRVGRVNEPGFFGWAQDGVLAFSQRTAPSGITVETEARTVDPWLLARLDWSELVGPDFSKLNTGHELNPEIIAMIRRWVGPERKPWLMAQRLMDGLRSEFIVDCDAGIPEGCTDPVGYFLLESRRGPDYLFATAAAALLKHCGLTTRLVNGFYVDPGKYDPETGHTPVTAGDLHFWVEVATRDGDWLVVEPTPGYRVCPPVLPFWERLSRAGRRILEWSGEHSVWLVGAFTVLGFSFLWRREILDQIRCIILCIPNSAGIRWRVMQTARLLEWRGRVSGYQRRPCQSGSAWLSELAPLGDTEDMAVFSRLVAWAAHAPAGDDCPQSLAAEKVMDLSSRVLAQWGISRLRRAARVRGGGV